MVYKIIWEDAAKESYFKEIEFILFKWNLKEVYKFEGLVTANLMLLTQNTHIANYSKETKIFRLVISKQTTVYFELIGNNIHLLLFWNNQKDPAELLRTLKQI